MWQARSDSRIFTVVFVCTVLLAWAALVYWGSSPAGYLLNHRELGDHVVRLDSHYALAVALFALGWTLMTIAMMLPTTLPLLDIFRGITRTREDRSLLLVILLSGYLTVWIAFGIGAHLFDFLIHQAVDSDAWLHSHTWLLVASPLLLAGIYEFTPLKHLCLDKCRSPFSFVAERWRGVSPKRNSFWLGVRHGIFCLGCCWALMLLMFAMSIGSLAWMLLLAAAMGAEKNMAWGRRISTPIGLVLLTAGLTILVRELPLI